MKAAVFEKVGKLVVGQYEEPKIKSDELLVRIKACGICGTDIHLLNGKYSGKYPLIPGHEFAGEVIEVGSDVKDFAVGDRIAGDPNNQCGKCTYCRKGKIHLCKNLDPLGVTKPGGFAELCAVPAVQAFKLPENLSWQQGALMEPAACAVRGIEVSGIFPGDTVAVLGCGTMGNLITQLSALAGAAKVVVSEPIEAKRELALQCGATNVIDPTKEDVKKALLEIDPDGADVVFEVAGLKQTAQLSLDLAKRGGTVVFFGVVEPEETVQVHPYNINEYELTIVGSFNNPLTNSRALDIIASGRIKTEPLVSHTFTLDEFEKGFAHFGAIDAFKIMIMP